MSEATDSNVTWDTYLSELEGMAQWEEQMLQRHEALQRIEASNLRVIEQLLNGEAPIQLELGAGTPSRLPGWTTVDSLEGCDLTLDLRNPLPFPDESVTQIYSSHLLEHLAYPSAMLSLLAECRRVLKLGGIFSVCVPNARIYIDAYLNPEKFDPDQYCVFKPAYHYSSPIDFINYMAYMGGHHLHLFDQENLLAVLTQVGFRKVIPRNFDPAIDLQEREFESIYAIAEK
jgi:predicted SAM-dependent methyltransferase